MAPPLRLVSAAMWHVMQRKDVRHYGKLEEFVTSVSEAVPGLLSYRHRAKLTLGLRARLILELFRTQDPPDPAVILPHLDRIKPPLHNKRDEKVQCSASSFRLFVRALLDSPAEREQFFQEVFVVNYGPQFDSALEKLLWEFLSRLDQLLPVPDLAQTVSWLSAAPCVLEDCEQPISQPVLLNTLLQHHKRLGHLNSAASLPSFTGDSILSSLSLPPSGRVQSTSQETNSLQSAVWPDSQSPVSLTHPANHRQGSSSPIEPIIGLIACQDLPLTPSKGKRVETAQATPIISKEMESGVGSPHSLYRVKLRSWASLDRGGARQEGAERNEGRGGACDKQEACFKRRTLEEEQGMGGGGEDRAGLRKSEHQTQERRSHREDRSAPRPQPQEGAALSPLVISCLQVQPQVQLERLSLADIAPPVLSFPRLPGSGDRSPWRPGEAASPSRGWCPATRKRKLSGTVTPEKRLPNSSEKENSADSSLMWGTSPVLSLRTNSGASLPSFTGDSILSSLSLPPSGRVQSTSQETNSLQSAVWPDSQSPVSLTHPANHRQGSSSPIEPIIGLIACQDLPLTPSKGKRVETAQATPIISKEMESGVGSPHSLYRVKLRSWASLDRGGARQEGAERNEGRGGACDKQEACFKRRTLEEEQGMGGGGEDRAGLRKSEHQTQERRSHREDRSAPRPQPQEGAALSPLVISCLQVQPQVQLERLSLADIAPPVLSFPRLPGSGDRSPRRPGEAASPSRGWCPATRKRKLSGTVTPEKRLPNSSEKENSADSSLMWGTSPVLSLRTNSGGRDSLSPDFDDDIIIDSEDDEINNVKGRLFVKQYYRTKNNTFVPTLREFWGHSLA